MNLTRREIFRTIAAGVAAGCGLARFARERPKTLNEHARDSPARKMADAVDRDIARAFKIAREANPPRLTRTKGANAGDTYDVPVRRGLCEETPILPRLIKPRLLNAVTGSDGRPLVR